MLQLVKQKKAHDVREESDALKCYYSATPCISKVENKAFSIRLLNLIGSGSCGTVYRALYDPTYQFVAVIPTMQKRSLYDYATMLTSIFFI